MAFAYTEGTLRIDLFWGDSEELEASAILIQSIFRGWRFRFNYHRLRLLRDYRDAYVFHGDCLHRGPDRCLGEMPKHIMEKVTITNYDYSLQYERCEECDCCGQHVGESRYECSDVFGKCGVMFCTWCAARPESWMLKYCVFEHKHLYVTDENTSDI